MTARVPEGPATAVGAGRLSPSENPTSCGLIRIVMGKGYLSALMPPSLVTTPNNLFAKDFADTGRMSKVFWGKPSRSVNPVRRGLNLGGKGGGWREAELRESDRRRRNEEDLGRRRKRIKRGRGAGREGMCAVWRGLEEARVEGGLGGGMCARRGAQLSLEVGSGRPALRTPDREFQSCSK